MKKIAVIGIGILFLLVAFKYASAQTILGGHLTTLSLDVTYRAEVPATKTLLEGKKLITVASGLFNSETVSGKSVKKYDPVLYWDFDANGNLIKIVFDWLSPNPTVVSLPDVVGGRIYTISCSGGNQVIPLAPVVPDLGPGGVTELLDGLIGAKPELPVKNTPATYTSSAEGIATCYFCPEGFQFSAPGVTTGVCNDGSSYGKGYLVYKATGSGIPTSGSGGPTSISVIGEVGGAGFIYNGADWASADYTGSGTPKALFEGTFSATLTPCADSTCSTL